MILDNMPRAKEGNDHCNKFGLIKNYLKNVETQ